jgi:hypothetical protein
VKLDADNLTIEFSSAEELDAFHRELTVLLREVTVSVTGKTSDANEARERAKDVLREFKMVARIVNAFRRSSRRSSH